MQCHKTNKYFWLCHPACTILVPQPGIEPVSPAVEVWSLNHWTTREVPKQIFKKLEIISSIFSIYKDLRLEINYKKKCKKTHKHMEAKQPMGH